jgi:hypothetical protein
VSGSAIKESNTGKDMEKRVVWGEVTKG